jgi:hypothetical protein
VQFLHTQATDQTAELLGHPKVFVDFDVVMLIDPLSVYAETAPPYSMECSNDQNVGMIFAQGLPLIALFLSVNFFGSTASIQKRRQTSTVSKLN